MAAVQITRRPLQLMDVAVNLLKQVAVVMELLKDLSAHVIQHYMVVALMELLRLKEKMGKVIMLHAQLET